MADNVAITPGVGASVGTEDQSGVHIQKVTQQPRLTSPFSEVAINASSSGDNTIVSLAASQKVRLYRFFLSANASVNVKWRDGTAGSDFHPVVYLLGNGAYWELLFFGPAWFTTTAGNALVLNLSAAVQVSGRAYYIQAA